SPAAFVTAHLLHRAQLLEERGAVGFAVPRRISLAADYESQLAILEVDGSRAWLWLPSTMIAWRLNHDRLARRAFVQLRRFAAVTLGLHGIDRSPIDVERPFEAVFGQAVAIHGARMIEDDCIGFAVGRPEHATNHLAEQAHLLGGACEDATAHGGHVPAPSGPHAICEHFGLAGSEGYEDCCALGDRCLAVQMLGTDPELLKLVFDVD